MKLKRGTYRRGLAWRGWPREPALTIGLVACVALAGGAARAATAYPAMAPVGEYMMADPATEIALARSAGPPSISADAEVLVLGPNGYVSAGPGKNGFVCIVSRSWFSGLKDDGFWDPKERGPICFNRESARSVLPTYLQRTTWVLAGVSRDEILTRTTAAMATGQIPPPETASMTFMLSKQGDLGDNANGGPWRPHLMFYMPPIPTADWGANLPGTRVYGDQAAGDPYTVFYVPVGAWSDGSPYEAPATPHHM
jgi:hypothetical protein